MKKKIIIILSVIGLCFGLAGCSADIATGENTIPSVENEDISIWTDDETGVQYIIYSHGQDYQGMGGITPRLNADGSLYAENKESEE
jgi:maltose-binding protein MalE